MITSQIPVDRWHEIIGDPTYADAIFDRLVHNAHRIDLADACAGPEESKPGKVDQPPVPDETLPPGDLKSEWGAI
jgi:hypothetical protein